MTKKYPHACYTIEHLLLCSQFPRYRHKYSVKTNFQRLIFYLISLYRIYAREYLIYCFSIINSFPIDNIAISVKKIILFCFFFHSFYTQLNWVPNAMHLPIDPSSMGIWQHKTRATSLYIVIVNIQSPLKIPLGERINEDWFDTVLVNLNRIHTLC